MKIKEYRPAFFDIDVPLAEAEIAKPEDAFNVPFVRRHAGPYEIIDGVYVRDVHGFVVAIIDDFMENLTTDMHSPRVARPRSRVTSDS